MIIGLLREKKTYPDRRVALLPYQCRQLLNTFADLQIIIEPSLVRCVEDEEYKLAGLVMSQDLSKADILLGIKEVPAEHLIPNKTYLFFSHTIKKQAYNKDLLRAAIQKNICLIDYECLKDDSGARLAAFGRYAGIVGAYHGLRAYGIRYDKFMIEPAWKCANLESLISNQLSKVILPPIKIIMTGAGRVGQGAMEILAQIGVKQVSPKQFLEHEFDCPVVAQLHSKDYYLPPNNQDWASQDFYQNPENYSSDFIKYAHKADILIATAYWNPNAPRLFELSDLKNPAFAIKIIADITCDMNGSIPCTLQPSLIEAPYYDYEKETGEIHPPFSSENHISIMAIDNLPCELPRDASEDFGKQLIENILPELLNNKFSDLIERATITKNGQLCDAYSYLQDFVNE